jgi:hypothetical protein
MFLTLVSKQVHSVIKYKCRDSTSQITEVIQMLENVTEFFKNLPPKLCSDCGEIVEEQHECYGDKCDKCLGVTDIKN